MDRDNFWCPKCGADTFHEFLAPHDWVKCGAKNHWIGPISECVRSAKDRPRKYENGIRKAKRRHLRTKNKRLKAVIRAWQAVGDAIMLAVTGRDARLSESEVIGEFNRLRAENAQLSAALIAERDALREQVAALAAERDALAVENERLQAAWLKHETIQPDGELGVKMDDLIAERDVLDDQLSSFADRS